MAEKNFDVADNHGTIDAPEWGDDKAMLTLKQTPIYSAILSACARKHSQESMIEFLEDWSDELAPFIDVEASYPASIRQAISAVRRLKIKAKGDKTIEQGDMRASMSAMEEIEAQGDTDPLPVLIQYTGPIYEGLGACTVAMRLKVHLNKEVPEFGLRVMSAEKLADQIAKDITAKIAGEVGCQVYTGKSSFSR